jgi:hypothetical protein
LFIADSETAARTRASWRLCADVLLRSSNAAPSQTSVSIDWRNLPDSVADIDRHQAVDPESDPARRKPEPLSSERP